MGGGQVRISDFPVVPGDILDAFETLCDAEGNPAKEKADSYVSPGERNFPLSRLAQQGGDSARVDQEDFNALVMRPDMMLLSDLIETDTSFQTLVRRRAALEMGEVELRNNGNGGIMPQHYRRIVFLAQLALREMVDQNLQPNGIYDEQTAAAVAVFQQGVGITDGNAGRKMGPQTLGLLVMRSRYNALDVLGMMVKDRDALGEGGGFYIPQARGDHLRIAAHIAEGLKWLGFLRIDAAATSTRADDAYQASQLKHGMVTSAGIDRIAMMVMGAHDVFVTRRP